MKPYEKFLIRTLITFELTFVTYVLGGNITYALPAWAIIIFFLIPVLR